MFNGKLNPVIPYAIRGCIWNQGYANIGGGLTYYNNLHSLISGWRKCWNRPELPVCFHQFYCRQMTVENFKKTQNGRKFGNGPTDLFDSKNPGVMLAKLENFYRNHQAPVRDSLYFPMTGIRHFQPGEDFPLHDVAVNKVYIAKHEVTKALWDKIRFWGTSHGYTDLPSGEGRAADHPVQLVSCRSVLKDPSARHRSLAMEAKCPPRRYFRKPQSITRRTSVLWSIICLLPTARAQQANEDPVTGPVVQPVSAERFEVRNMEGWTIYTNRDVLKQYPEQMAKTFGHLKWDLYQIKLAAPATAVCNLQEHTPIWIEYDEKVGLSYHPETAWLLERGYKLPKDPDSMISLSAKGYVGDSYRHPFVIFHEMTHGYDHHFIGKGHDYGNAECEANYQRMMKSGINEKVKIWDGGVGSHYARTNRMEYLAESSEAYFGVNDIYPFVRAELREQDPAMARLVERYWGVDPRQIIRLETSLATYLDHPQAAAATAKASGPAKGKYIPTSQYDKRDVDGWTVYVNPQLARQPGLCTAMVKILNYKLHVIDHFISVEGQKQLHAIPVWLEYGRKGPYLQYCGDSAKLQLEGVNPDKLGAVEIGDPQRMMDWSMLQQSDVLHQVALAYYDRHAQKDSDLGRKIAAAYDQAKKDGKYNSVLRFDGKRVSLPAMTSEKEYFAELMESYFLVNDHYPFIRCELKDQDATGYAVIADLWQGNPHR